MDAAEVGSATEDMRSEEWPPRRRPKDMPARTLPLDEVAGEPWMPPRALPRMAVLAGILKDAKPPLSLMAWAGEVMALYSSSTVLTPWRAGVCLPDAMSCVPAIS